MGEGFFVNDTHFPHSEPPLYHHFHSHTHPVYCLKQEDRPRITLK